MKHRLEIKPAISPKARHAIERFLEDYFGYEVIGGGTMADLSSCDISFERDDPRDENEKDSDNGK